MSPKNLKTTTYVFLLLTFAIGIAYCGSLHNPWVFDDKPNILYNKSLHLVDLSFPSIKQTFFACPDSPGKLFRPLSTLSLALNWYWGRDNVIGYHLINITIHICVAFFLYLSCIQLLNTPSVSNEYNSEYFKHVVALATALLWSLNPVQTQAVTYIVQRMAALAALFFIIGIYYFLKARLSPSRNQKFIYSIICLFCFACAMASKENAILFPVSLLLIEFIFFNTSKRLLQITKKQKKFYFFLTTSIIISLFLLGGHYLTQYLDYSKRTFTLSERLLTEPKILLFYLSLLFYPAASRLSLEHDVVLSTSLFTPIDTFASILLCLTLIGIGLALSKRKPLIAFALLFFFLNHVVESTIIPLELIFEHRNYLPSLFLFLPIAAFIFTINQKWHNTSQKILPPVFLAILIIFFGYNTYTRNKAWASELTLWEDAQTKAPQNGRVASNLAIEYIHSEKLNKALILLKKSYNLPQASKNFAEAVSLNGQGYILNLQGKFPEAEFLFSKSLAFSPDYDEARKNLIMVLMKLNRPQDALALFKSNDPRVHFHDITLQATVLMKLNEPLEALRLFKTVPKNDLLPSEIMIGRGKAMSMLGHHNQADFFLRQAARYDLPSALFQIENLILAKETAQTRTAIAIMFATFPAQAIFDHLTHPDPLDYPLDRKILYPIVMQQAEKIVHIEDLQDKVQWKN